MDVQRKTFEKMTRKQVSEFLGIPNATLDFWACMHPERLRYFKIGKHVYYDRADVETYLQSCSRGGQVCTATL